MRKLLDSKKRGQLYIPTENLLVIVNNLVVAISVCRPTDNHYSYQWLKFIEKCDAKIYIDISAFVCGGFWLGGLLNSYSEVTQICNEEEYEDCYSDLD